MQVRVKKRNKVHFVHSVRCISANNPTPASHLFPRRLSPIFSNQPLHPTRLSNFGNIGLTGLYIFHNASRRLLLLLNLPRTHQVRGIRASPRTSQRPSDRPAQLGTRPHQPQHTQDQRNPLTSHHPPSNFSNIASLLWHAYAALPPPSSSVNWAGFYIRQDKFPALGSPQNTPSSNTDTNTNLLLLGPFQGRPACQEIRFGRGVCGTAAEKRETVIVPDVLSFPGHIACDASSRSEIVVPVLVDGETVAIIDIDCTEPAGFDEEDKKWLEELAALLSECCDW